jgi:hypothetical protein
LPEGASLQSGKLREAAGELESRAYKDIDALFFDFTMIMELFGFIFIGASISVLLERDAVSPGIVKKERVSEARKNG